MTQSPCRDGAAPGFFRERGIHALQRVKGCRRRNREFCRVSRLAHLGFRRRLAELLPCRSTTRAWTAKSPLMRSLITLLLNRSVAARNSTTATISRAETLSPILVRDGLPESRMAQAKRQHDKSDKQSSVIHLFTFYKKLTINNE
jgi:hypothetical protein